MKFKYSVLSLFLLALINSCATRSGKALVSHIPLTTNATFQANGVKPYRFSTTGVLIASKRHFLRLAVLDATAQSYLAAKAVDFPPAGNSLSLCLEIRCSSPEPITLIYTGTIGEQYWSVTFDASGAIIGHKTGVVTDTVL